MSRNRDSLKHELRVRALEGVTDSHTKRSYKRSTDSFASWAKERGIKSLGDVTADWIQKYEEWLENSPSGYSPATIHTYLAPVCKAAGVSMRKIRKPKRTAGEIKRGRGETEKGRGEREERMERYKRVVDLQNAVGIRRSELARLTGADWDGKYITVRRGKGGKAQRQFVLPADRETVNRVFAGVGAQERVFSGEEMQSHINLHAMRAEHARDCYKYYADRLSGRPDMREKMRSALMARWDEANQGLYLRDPEKWKRTRNRFRSDLYREGEYRLRGEVKAKAEAAGLPVVYDRLALMCVSVCHLSHWRLDVTTVNYMVP